MKRTKSELLADKRYKAIGVGERTSRKVSLITKEDGTRFRRKNANQYGNAEGGNDYVEKRANRSDKYAKGGKAKEPTIVRGFSDDEPYEYGKGGKTPKIIRGFSDDEAYEYGQGGKTKGGIYEVYLDMGKSGTETIADFETTKDAKDFIYEYMLKHPKAKLGYDKLTHDYTNKYAKGGKTNCWCYSIGGL